MYPPSYTASGVAGFAGCLSRRLSALSDVAERDGASVTPDGDWRFGQTKVTSGGRVSTPLWSWSGEQTAQPSAVRTRRPTQRGVGNLVPLLGSNCTPHRRSGRMFRQHCKRRDTKFRHGIVRSPSGIDEISSTRTSGMKAALCCAQPCRSSKTTALGAPNHSNSNRRHVPVFRPLALSGTSSQKPHTPRPALPQISERGDFSVRS